MLTSQNWLSDYVDLSMSLDELIDRLTMSGLNHDGTEDVGNDAVLDLEVTSNRADCLGHIGIAREVATLFQTDLKVPDPRPKTESQSVSEVCSVKIENPETCRRYTARVIRGVKIGSSPQWMQDRLSALGIGIVNNIVDVTNYVMFECGQPLHAFDLKKVKNGQIVVRNARSGEKLDAIDHRTYELNSQMCVIADSDGPLGLGGVMGGTESEVSDATTDILIEAAYFDQLAIRNTARALNLYSPSSFRFERDINSENLDWASRRCCQLILETAGGQLLDGVVDVGQQATPSSPVQLRYAQLKRILGIEIPQSFVPETLARLGMSITEDTADSITVIPPSWRKDLTREIDLVEEVGRIYGYHHVPDNVSVPMASSYRPVTDRVLDKVRSVVTAAGFDECVTASLVPQPWSDSFSPWTDLPALRSSQPMLGVLEKTSQNIGAVDLLRRSLVPSLLEVRRINEYRSNEQVELFETAKVYLPSAGNELPDQPTKLALVSSRDYLTMKGVVESLVAFVAPSQSLQWESAQSKLLDNHRSGKLMLGEKRLGWLGEVSSAGLKQFGLRSGATVCEIDLAVLTEAATLVPRHQNQSVYQAVKRDFNFILKNEVFWSDLESSVLSASGELLEKVSYRETFRDEAKDGPDKKRVLLSVVLRSSTETLTNQQVEEISSRIIDRCKTNHGASLA